MGLPDILKVREITVQMMYVVCLVGFSPGVLEFWLTICHQGDCWCHYVMHVFMRCNLRDVPAVGRRRWRRLPADNGDWLIWETTPCNGYNVDCSATAATMKHRPVATTTTSTLSQSSSKNTLVCCTSGGLSLSMPALGRSWSLLLWTKALIHRLTWALTATPRSHQ